MRSRGLQTEYWGNILYGLLVLRIKDPGVKCRCVILLDATSVAEDVLHCVGIVKPVFVRDFAC